jgi:phage baseplate assembly protein gpV
MPGLIVSYDYQPVANTLREENPMKIKIPASHFALFLGLLLSAQLVQAEDEFRARIVKVQGEVYVINDRGEQRSPEKSKFLVNKMETVVTQEGAKAVVQFDDGAMSVLDEKSSLRVEQSGWLSQLSGRAYYIFRKVFGQQRELKKVKTKFATIGIRGTSFIVSVNDGAQGIALQDGKLNIESPSGEYAIHTQQQVDEFDAFKQQMQEKQQALQREYDDYRKNIDKEFVEYKRSFDLQANRVVAFDGNQVRESDLSVELEQAFDQFEAFAGEYARAYKELDEETN